MGAIIHTCREQMQTLMKLINNGEADEHLCPSLGAIDWPAVVRRLRDVGFPGPLTLECRPPPDVPPDGIRAFVLNALGLDA